MTLEPLSKSALKRLYRTEMKQAFPPDELKPFFAMERLTRQGRYQPLAAMEGGVPVGYALLWLNTDAGLALIDYFWVTAARRGQGVGSRMLSLLSKHYARQKGLLVEAEHPRDETWDGHAEAVRRLAFYRRAGFATLDYDCALFGVRYKTLWHTCRGAAREEILQAHRDLYLNRNVPAPMRRYFQIPLGPDEKINMPFW